MTKVINNRLNKASILLFVAVLVVVLANCSIASRPDTSVYVSDGSVPLLIPDGELSTRAVPGGVKITRYNGREINIIVPGTVRGLPVVGITEGAFQSKGLIGAILPNGIESIDALAFANNSLVDVTLGKGLARISASTFNTNVNLTKVTIEGAAPPTIPASSQVNNGKAFVLYVPVGTVPEYEKSPFGGLFTHIYPIGTVIEADFLTENVPGGVNIIGYKGTSNDFTIPARIAGEGVQAIADSAFKSQNIVSVTLSDNIAKIGPSAFEDNPLVTVTIGSGLAEISPDAFNENPNLARITVNSATPPALSASTVPNDRKFTVLYVPAGAVTTYENSPFGRLFENVFVIGTTSPTDFQTTNSTGGVIITGYIGTATDITVPTTIDGKTVLEIEKGVFQSKGLTGVVLPTRLRILGESAFAGNNITTKDLALPSTLTSIGDSAFAGNKISGRLTLPSGLKTIGASAFTGNEISGAFTLPNGITSVGDSAFNSNNISGALTIPSSLTAISRSVFANNDLTTLTIQSGVTSIGDNAFVDNKINGTLVLHSGITTIGESAFSGNKFTGLTLADGLKSIGANAFKGNEIAGSLTMPSGVETIGASAFVTNKLTALTLPDALTSIGNSAFKGNDIANAITIPSGVVSIGSDAFADNAFTNLTLTDTLVSIGSRAFKGNDIPIVHITGGSPPATAFGSNVFESATKTLYVPNGQVAAYQAATNWSSIFTAIKTVLTTDVVSIQELTNSIKITGYSGSDRDIVIPWTLDGPTKNGLLVTHIGDGVFQSKNLTSVVLPANLNYIGKNAFAYNSLKAVDFPNSLIAIGSYGFAGNQLKTVVIGNGVNQIQGFSFWGNGTTSITLGSNVRKIGGAAFGIANITDITIKRTEVVIPVNVQAVSYLGDYTTLYVPSSMVASYQATGWWNSRVGSIVAIP